MSCELCDFKNPKGTVTAIILKDNKILVSLRNQEPFKNVWDLPGGYMQEEEGPGFAIKRELNEEFGLRDIENTFIKTFTGKAFWNNEEFPILSHVFLVDIKDQNLKLNEENSQIKWMDLKDFDPKLLAFDSNQEIGQWVKEKFQIDIDRIKYLISQLDPSAVVNEQSYYRAVLNGYVSKIEEEGQLMGMGWVFPRQTLLRKQAVIEDMIVDESQRGKGYGRKILQDLIQWCRDQKIEVLELTTNPKRIAANELYKSEGFWLHETNHYLLNLNK